MSEKTNDTVVLTCVTAAFAWLFRRQIIPNTEQSNRRWRQEPTKQVGRVCLSAILGQGLFWTVGYDQLGVLMDTKVQLGFGQKVAETVFNRLPKLPAVSWLVKAIEILMDFSKMLTEGPLYKHCGIVPDSPAVAVSQPLYSLIEAAEKVAGVVSHPERVTCDDSVKVSLGCIYGTLVRHGMSGCILLTSNLFQRRRVASRQ